MERAAGVIRVQPRRSRTRREGEPWSSVFRSRSMRKDTEEEAMHSSSRCGNPEAEQRPLRATLGIAVTFSILKA